MVPMYNGIYSALKRNEILICYNVNEPWKHAKWNTPDTKGQLLYDSMISFMWGT